MNLRTASLLALCTLLLVSPLPAFAQSSKDNALDLKPLLPPMRPFLPPNSSLTPGTVEGVSPSPYSSGPMYDSARQPLPAPGIRLTIPR